MGNNMAFQPWQCISLIRYKAATLDLVVKDVDDMMYLISYLNKHVSRRKRISTVAPYILLKFKMKLSFETWQSKIPMKIHVIQSILKTVNEQYELACHDLRNFFINKDGCLDGETDVIPEESEPDCSPYGVPDGVPNQNYSSKVSENTAGMTELINVASQVLV